MSKRKTITVAVAFMMLAVGFLAMVQITDGSNATPSGSYTQNVNVYYYEESGSEWGSYTIQAFNLYAALDGAKGHFGYTISTAEGNGSWVSGYNPNENYGVITQVNGSTTFNIYAFDGSTWIDVTGKPIGWIRPFADYGATVVIPGVSFSASANVAIVLADQSSEDLPTTGVQTMPSVSGYTNTLYQFNLYDKTSTLTFSNMPVKTLDSSGEPAVTHINNTAIQGTNQLKVYGYGSDAYLALIDALGTSLLSDNLVPGGGGKIYAWVNHDVYNSDNVYQYSYKTYYSWMDKVFGYGTVQTGTGYNYWASYNGDTYTDPMPDTSYLNFSFGYYSQLEGAYNGTNGHFVLAYV